MNKATTAPPTKEKAVVVTTKDRGVFFGYITGEPCRAQMKLARARNCIYWAVETKGFVGLAATGPLGPSKVGPAADITLFQITSVADATPAAIDRWESGPWG